MLARILFLFLCASSVSAQSISVSTQSIKERTQRHLMAMTNISATQTVNGQNYRVAMFRGQQVFNRRVEMPRIGIRPGTEWYSLLQDSQLWKLTPNSDHYRYRDFTRWFEIARITLAADDKWEGVVECEGEVYVVDNNIMRITQRFNPNRLTQAVAIDMVYAWVQLKEKRLLPAQMTMHARFKNGDGHVLNVRWSNYKEFGTELVIKEPEHEERVWPIAFGEGFSAEPPSEQTETPDFGLPTPVEEDINQSEKELPLLNPAATRKHKTKKVRTNTRWRLFSRVFKF